LAQTREGEVNKGRTPHCNSCQDKKKKKTGQRKEKGESSVGRTASASQGADLEKDLRVLRRKPRQI